MSAEKRDPLNTKIKPLGVSLTGFATYPEGPPPEPLNIRGTLSDMLHEYSFYTPALLHLTVPLEYDPFHVYLFESNRTDIQRYSVKFNKRIFAYLDHPNKDASWNYVLFALKKENFNDYISYMGTCAYVNKSKSRVYRVRSQEITIKDPTASLAGDWIPVTALAIETNAGSFYFKTNVVTGLPEAAFDSAVTEANLQFSNNLLIGNSDPYNTKD